MITVRLRYHTSGLNLWAYPKNQSKADWSTYREAFSEDSVNNPKLYTVTLDETSAEDWIIFSRADSEPTDWDDGAIGEITLTRVTKNNIRSFVQGEWVNQDDPTDKINFTIQDSA